jgi:type II secretion system protein N
MNAERRRKLRKVGLHAGVGFVVFLIAFYASLPYDRFKDQVVALASQRNMDVEIGSAGPTLGIGIAFGDIRIATRPTDGSKPTRLRIESAKIGVSPLARLSGQDAASVSAEALSGDIGIDYRGNRARAQVRVKARELAMAELPGVKDAINLPLAGKLDLNLNLTVTPNRVTDTNGSLGWTCAGCAIGDGKAKLRIAGNPMLAEGLSLPQVRLGDFTGKVVIEKGMARLQTVQARSLDGEIYIEGEIRLVDPFPQSLADLYVRFKATDAFIKKSDKLQLLMQLADAGKRSDGYYGVRLTGALSRLSSTWSKTSPFSTGAPGRNPTPPHAGPRPAPAVGMPMMTPPTVDPAKDPTANMPRYPTEAPPPPPSAPPPPPPAPAPSAEPDAE